MAGEKCFTAPKSLYSPEKPEQAAALCREFQASDAELATFFSVAPSTIQRWRDKHPEFKKAIEEVRALQTHQVEQRLYERAIGYSHKAVKIMQYEGNPIEVEYTEHYPPDVEAAKFWLKNRAPDDWKDAKLDPTALQGVVVPVIQVNINPGPAKDEEGGERVIEIEPQKDRD